jgi:hypothetical protein
LGVEVWVCWGTCWWVWANVQKRDSREISRESDSASHGAADQLLAFAALVLSTALVGFNEGLADAEWGRGSESASQLLCAWDLNWRFIQLWHIAGKLWEARAPPQREKRII